MSEKKQPRSLLMDAFAVAIGLVIFLGVAFFAAGCFGFLPEGNGQGNEEPFFFTPSF